VTPTSEIVFDPILPIAVVLMMGAVLVAISMVIHWKTGQRTGPGKRTFLTLLRVVGIVGLIVLLLQPSRRELIPPPSIEKLVLFAVDESASMQQNDVSGVTRFDAATQLLMEARQLDAKGQPVNARARIQLFAKDARPLGGPLLDVQPNGESTRFHQSLTTVLNGLQVGQGAHALIVLSDGHDFELVNPSKTGMMLRSRQIPVYAVPIGGAGRSRDVSVRITSFQPFTYVNQKAVVQASLRLIGCEFEDLQVTLLRQGKVVETRHLNADEHLQLTVDFEVEESETGQFEYEVAVRPLEKEVSTDNNNAITYLNVIDQQVRVLVLEGAPYWDTTFLQRSLMRNDKMSVDSMVQYTEKKVRRIRSEEREGELVTPTTMDEWGQYDLVILGRSMDRLLNEEQLGGLTRWVEERGGVVVFSRGPAFDGDLAGNALEPVIWKKAASTRVKLTPTREGRSVAPFRLLQSETTANEEVPELLAVHDIDERRPLTATLAGASGTGADSLPGMVHRRYGRGQLVSVGVEGLWRWAFNAKIEGVNTLFDRFWDQIIIWLMSGRDVLPDEQFSLRASTANLVLGEKVHLRLSLREPNPTLKNIPVTVFRGDEEVSRFQLVPDELYAGARLTGEYLPEQTGRYRAVAAMPDGSELETRFIAFSENLEETDVSMDANYLRRLCQSSGGRLLKPEELNPLLDQLMNEQVAAEPTVKIVSIWDQTWVFYLLGGIFGLDWYMRRKWGLC